MKIIITIKYNLRRVALRFAKMERKLDLLETYSSRSQEKDNLELNNFHCWY